MARAESSTSRRYALSLDIEWLSAREDGMPAVGVLAALNGTAADEIDAAVEYLLQTLLDLDPLEKSAFDTGPDGGKEVHVVDPRAVA